MKQKLDYCYNGGKVHTFHVLPGEGYYKERLKGKYPVHDHALGYHMLLCSCGETKEIIAEDHRPIKGKTGRK